MGQKHTHLQSPHNFLFLLWSRWNIFSHALCAPAMEWSVLYSVAHLIHIFVTLKWWCLFWNASFVNSLLSNWWITGQGRSVEFINFYQRYRPWKNFLYLAFLSSREFLWSLVCRPSFQLSFCYLFTFSATSE